MSSESEDEKLKVILADPTVLNFFQCNEIKGSTKSQRYLNESSKSDAPDMDISTSMQHFVYKKLSKMIEQSIEFETNTIDFKVNKNTSTRTATKSKLQLLRGYDSFIEVNNAEENVNTTSKRLIKKRTSEDLCKKKKLANLQSVVVNGNDVIAGVLTRSWAKKKERKIFYYKAGVECVCVEKEIERNFSKSGKK